MMPVKRIRHDRQERPRQNYSDTGWELTREYQKGCYYTDRWQRCLQQIEAKRGKVG
jgi:hypothetical protein